MHRRKKPLLLSAFIILLLSGIMLFQVISRSGTLSPFLFNFFFNKNIELKTADDHINILLLGIGGTNHEGPNLTDTIILVSIDKKTNKVVLNSIPRDLWIPFLTGANKKINGAYANGEDKKKDGGITLTKAIVQRITGQEVNYAVVIDFSGFVKAVDSLGGLDIIVDTGFDDYQYPVAGKEADPCDHTQEEIDSFVATNSAEAALLDFFPCRYIHIHFDKGLNHMDGETALEFVRSRHATGSEGTDFARSKRQEKIISALKDKIFSAQTLINPARMIGLYSIVAGSIKTDVSQNELDDFAKLAQKMSNAKIQSSIIDAGDDIKDRPGLLVYGPISKEFGYLSVLIPRVGNGNFSEIKSYIMCQITKGNCTISKIPQ